MFNLFWVEKKFFGVSFFLGFFVKKLLYDISENDRVIIVFVIIFIFISFFILDLKIYLEIECECFWGRIGFYVNICVNVNVVV